MSNDFRFELDHAGVNTLINSPEIVSMIESSGRRVRDAANNTLEEREGYEMEVKTRRTRDSSGGGRPAAVVYAASIHATRSNAKHGTLEACLSKAGS